MKTALIFGSSGLIGNQLLSIILQNNNYNKIKLFVRLVPENNDSKVEIIQTDFTNLEKHKDSIVGDDCFFCIGTTRKDAPDQNEYRRIEYNIPINVAQIAKSNSVKTFVYVSSIGANPNSSSTYLKNKDNIFIRGIAILSPNLCFFLFPSKSEGRITASLGKFRLFNSSSTLPLFFK